MKKDIKKIIAVSMLASTLTTTIAPFYTSSAVEGSKKYANGIFTGEAYGFYKKEHGKQPIRVDVEFNNDNIVSIKVHDDKEGYKFPDDKGFGGRAYTRVGPFLEKKLMYNKDYEETLKKIEEDLEFIYDDFSDRTKEKRKVYDTITSATKTSEGITKATLDAVSQSRRAYKKNELSEKEDSSSGKKENSDIMLIDINDKDKKSKILHIGEYIDLNDLSVNVKYSDGKIKRIGYKEFKDSGIGIGLILNNGKK